MRIWSIHPKHLDRMGLQGLWRETLGAKSVLRKIRDGIPGGYQNHSQLQRFKKHPNAINIINNYLLHVFNEAKNRGFNFNINKIGKCDNKQLPVTTGQLEYELNHLKKKLKKRSPEYYKKLINSKIELHPQFFMVDGDIAYWEKV